MCAISHGYDDSFECKKAPLRAKLLPSNWINSLPKPTQIEWCPSKSDFVDWQKPTCSTPIERMRWIKYENRSIWYTTPSRPWWGQSHRKPLNTMSSHQVNSSGGRRLTITLKLTHDIDFHLCAAVVRHSINRALLLSWLTVLACAFICMENGDFHPHMPLFSWLDWSAALCHMWTIHISAIELPLIRTWRWRWRLLLSFVENNSKLIEFGGKTGIQYK